MIKVKNLYYMLSYAFQVLNEQGYKSIETESFDMLASGGIHHLESGEKDQ